MSIVLKDSASAVASAPAETIGMAQIAVVSSPGLIRAVLGSCVGLVLYHPQRRVAAAAHIVLPSGEGRGGPAGKFANTAIPFMLEQLAGHGAARTGLSAKLAGGSSMFATQGPIQIGEANQEAVKTLLAELRIPIAGQHLGGAKGRRISFDASTGLMTIEVVGAPTVVI